MTGENKIKAILIDGGNILFDDSRQKNELLEYLLEKQLIIPNINIKSVVKKDNLSLEKMIKNFAKKIVEYKPKDIEIISETKLKPALYAKINEKDFFIAYTKYKLKAQTEENYGRIDSYRDTLKELGCESRCNELIHYLAEKKKEKRKIIEGVKEVLKQLSRNGKKVIILTDATKHGDELKEQLKRLGYGNEITDIISSKDIGVTKPNPIFFEYALQKHGVSKDEVVFVGHDVDELDGAHRLGYSTIAFRYLPKDLENLKDIDYKINSADELAKIIENDFKDLDKIFQVKDMKHPL